jgi:hypothetical protein
MKHLLALLITSLISTAIVYAGDVKIEAIMTTGPDGEPTTSFTPDTPKIFALFKTKGVQDGDKIRSVWMADNVGNAAPPNTKIDEKTLTLKGDTQDGDFSLSKPTNGWPRGQYHLDIYVNGELATTVKFTIGGIKDSAKEATKEKEKEEASDEEYSFTVRNTTEDKITKLLASEDGEKYGSFDVGRAGIPAGKTVTLKWDKSTNDSNCEWFIKAVFEDGSETKAKKFDFCEEDLELEF